MVGNRGDLNPSTYVPEERLVSSASERDVMVGMSYSVNQVEIELSDRFKMRYCP